MGSPECNTLTPVANLDKFQSLIEFPPNSIQDFKQTIEDAQIHTICQGSDTCFKDLEILKCAHGHFLKLFEEQVKGVSDGKEHSKFAIVFRKWMKDLPKLLNIKSAQYVNISKLFLHTIRKNEQKFNELYLKFTQGFGRVTRVFVTRGKLDLAGSTLQPLIKFSNALLDQDEHKIGYHMLRYHELLKKHFKTGEINSEELSFDEETENSIDPITKLLITCVVVLIFTGILVIKCLSSEFEPRRRRRPAAPPG